MQAQAQGFNLLTFSALLLVLLAVVAAQFVSAISRRSVSELTLPATPASQGANTSPAGLSADAASPKSEAVSPPAQGSQESGAGTSTNTSTSDISVTVNGDTTQLHGPGPTTVSDDGTSSVSISVSNSVSASSDKEVDMP
jgi:hypothetical protein